MHPPSPALLRTLCKTITTPSPLLRPFPRATTNPTLTRLPITTHRTNSNTSNTVTRPQRIMPRAHKTKPSNHDRGPESTEQTQTDLSSLNVLGSVPAPTTAVDACLDSGFQLNNGLRVTGGSGALLVNGEAFAWRPWLASTGNGKEHASGEGKENMLNQRGQLDLSESAWGILDLVWPRPGTSSSFSLFLGSIKRTIR